MDVWSFPITVPCSPTLATLLIAGIYYSAILKLLNYVEVGAAQEQGEAKVVGCGETCSAGVHGAPCPRRPALRASVGDGCAGWAVHPLCAAAVGQGDTAPGQVPPRWARAVGAAGTHSAARAGEVPTSVCSAADKW